MSRRHRNGFVVIVMGMGMTMLMVFGTVIVVIVPMSPMIVTMMMVVVMLSGLVEFTTRPQEHPAGESINTDCRANLQIRLHRFHIPGVSKLQRERGEEEDDERV